MDLHVPALDAWCSLEVTAILHGRIVLPSRSLEGASQETTFPKVWGILGELMKWETEEYGSSIPALYIPQAIKHTQVSTFLSAWTTKCLKMCLFKEVQCNSVYIKLSTDYC